MKDLFDAQSGFGEPGLEALLRPVEGLGLGQDRIAAEGVNVLSLAVDDPVRPHGKPTAESEPFGREDVAHPVPHSG